ncbi:MAG: V-type ATP synthase subunit E family protein [Candidatus Omnitrophota bacterium]
MAEEIKNLIEKIQQEGIQAAEDKARQIEEQAKQKVNHILEKAKREAEKITQDAKANAAKMEESAKASLKQAARDLLITLRKEINSMLDKLIVSQVGQALDAHELSKIITLLIKECKDKAKEEIMILLKKEDLQKIEKGLLSELKEETKKGIVLKPSEDITGGFIISFDSGKSHYDFTDKALAEYISLYLKPKLGKILDGAI